MIEGGRRLFPLGLYATLLLGFCALALPDLTAGAERWLTGVQCLPLRAWQNLLGRSAAAARREPADRPPASFPARMRRAALRGARERVVGYEPIVCRVVATERSGGAELPSVLVLDRPGAEVEGCATFVTCADALVGFLQAESEDGRARVALLHDRAALRRVPARTGGSAPRRFLVEPAGAVDPWPLRCVLFDDAYRVALGFPEPEPVVTDPLDHDPQGLLPAGLRLGRVQVWGYAERKLVVGVFVEPDFDPRLLVTVVLWQRPGAEPRPEPRSVAAEWVELRISSLAVRGGVRWFAAHAGSVCLEPGAALVMDEALAGTVASSGNGFAFAAGLEESPSLCNFVVLPDDPVLDPVAVRGRILRQDGELWFAPQAPITTAGELFTGVGARQAPSGLWIGRVAPAAAGPAHLTPARSLAGASSAQACVAGDGQ